MQDVFITILMFGLPAYLAVNYVYCTFLRTAPLEDVELLLAAKVRYNYKNNR